MNIVTQKYCSRCKTTEGQFINFCTGRTGIKYYHCRPCNTERAKKYRATQNGKKKVFDAVYRSSARNKLQVKARWTVRDHLKRGKLTRPDTCSACNNSVTPEAHHDDYSKPLDVKWLCRPCHADLHRIIGKTRQPAI